MDVTTLAMAKAYTDKNMDSLFENTVSEIYWDGDTTGHDTSDVFCHISSLIPKMENIVGGSLTITENGKSRVVPLLEENTLNMGNGILMGEMVYSVLKLLEPGNSGVNLPKEGIWIRKKYNGAYVSKITFNTPIGDSALKKDIIPPTPLFDLDHHGINVQTLAMQGGGSAEIDASAIFDNIERGKNYRFRGSLDTNTLDILPAFYTYDSDGTLAVIGFSFSGYLSNAFVQCNVVMTRTNLTVVITPLGT